MNEQAATHALQGRVVVVTGGGGGIGSAISKRLARAGASIVITYRQDRAKAEAAVAALDGDDHMIARASVTESGVLDALAAQVRSRYARLDVLVNNAGISRAVAHDDLEALDDEIIDAIFATNWRGGIRLRARFSTAVARGRGRPWWLIYRRSPGARRSAATSRIAPPKPRWIR